MLLSWMIVSSCTIIYFFLNKFIFLNVYISVNTIFECFYMFFGWERGHPLSAYATSGCMKWSPEIRTAAHKGSERGCYAECVLTPLHYLFPCCCCCCWVFLQLFCSTVSRLTCGNLTYPSFKHDSKKMSSSERLFYSNKINLFRQEISFFTWSHSFANQS